MQPNNIIDLSKFEKMAEVLKVLSHPVRLNIILVLDKSGGLPVTRIVDKLGIDQTSISRHLTKMKLMKFLDAERKGKFVLYSVKDRGLIKLIQCFGKLNFPKIDIQ